MIQILLMITIFTIKLIGNNTLNFYLILIFFLLYKYMLKNSQFSHILLLCAIAYVIYCLTCPKTIKNTGTLEQINSSNSPVRSESEMSEDSSEAKPVVAPEVQSEDPVQSSSPVNTESSVSNGIVSEVEQEMKEKHEKD